MHIPVKVDYGVRALIDLALHADAQPIRASDIARRTMIPEPFLAQVMHAMGKNGIVRAQRGPQGGHALAMKPEEIRLSMVMDSLGSSENLMACLENTTSCVHVPSCSQREVWESVETAVYEILDTRTIADLVTRSRAMTGDETRGSNRQDIAVQSANN
ncbi:MAG: Rrf2 family transcriptional regulator [SAR202 cluster bacterium]|jgi:Rrf2 family protein|nr:Rrf2 family transcriptional regulator [SAR202 cluster bacterium]MDP7103971.1 Rrf2 family transcriptional regulator [SAR202 cluster bacterium]